VLMFLSLVLLIYVALVVEDIFVDLGVDEVVYFIGF